MFLGYVISSERISVDENKVEPDFKKLYVPKSSIRELLIVEAHGKDISGHFWINKMLEMLQENFFWPKMGKDVHTIVGEVCNLSKN